MEDQDLGIASSSFVEDWSGSSSYTSGELSDSDSSVPEWSSSVDVNTGELLFIDCHPFVTQNSNIISPKKPEETLNTSKSRDSTRGKFLRLIRRRESKRRSKRKPKSQDTNESISATKVKFRDFQAAEEREVRVKVDKRSFQNLVNTDSLIEAMLGFSVSTLSDGKRIMIAAFSSGSDIKNEKNIKIGDWLKSINDLEVAYGNLNAILQQVKDEEEVTLKLQRVAAVEVTKDPPINELSNCSRFVQQLSNISSEEEAELLKILCNKPIGILYLNTESFTEENTETEQIAYCYPRPHDKNILCCSRGIYVTLNQLMFDITKEKPASTTLLSNGQLAHVVYFSDTNRLLLLMLPASYLSLKEILIVFEEIIRFLKFTYQTLNRAFETTALQKNIDQFFCRFFFRIINNKNNLDACDDVLTETPLFESILPAATHFNLPNEAQLQIDNALTELESSDYREWNDDPLDCQRLFTMLGSAIYYSGYLLASHLAHQDLIDVNAFCRLQGLFQLSRSEPLRTLVFWKEVFPSSCNRGLESADFPFKFPKGRRYLLVIGSGKQLLAVLMEAGGCTEPSEDNMAPDAFYVEEVQATLSFIQELGIPELAEQWLAANPGSQTVVPEVPQSKRKSDFLGTFSKQSRQFAPPVQKKTEITSILKRRNSDQILCSSSTNIASCEESYDHYSEDSVSQSGYSEKSEVSDEQAYGRHNSRDKNFYDSDEEEEETEEDDYADGSQFSNSSFDLMDLKQSLLCEVKNLSPMRLTAGEENVLFHYVHLDETEGLLMCPAETTVSSPTLELILDSFRKCSQNIHDLFKNTLRFKNMPAQEMAKLVINKSLVAVKEYGTLFECPFQGENIRKNAVISFWVIGRLFYVPHPREFYVCYQDTVPQNLIEMAFKLGISASI